MASRNQRLDATITIGSVIDKTFGRNINVLRKGLDSVGDEIKGITDRQRELSKQRRVLERQGRSVDELDREYAQLGQTLDDLRRKQERFERAQGAANRAARQFGDASRQVGRTVRNASIAIGAVSAASFGLASSTAAAGDEFAKQARALGFNVEAYQELQYAAERSGVSAETFNSSMTAFTKRLGEAADGNGPAKDALDQLGLSAEELVGLEPDVALAKVADAMKDVRDPARRAALASDLFSRSGIRMTNVLNEGSTGIQALRDRARELGLVLSEDATTDSENFQDSLLNAQSAMLGIKNVIGAELIPVVGEMMDSFTEFVVTNQPQIKEFAETFATGFRDNLPLIKDTIIGFKDFAVEIGGAIGTVAEFVGGWDNLAIGLAAVKFAPLITSVAGLGVTLGRLVWSVGRLAGQGGFAAVGTAIKTLGGILLGNPIGLAVAGIAAGAYLIYKNWDGVSAWFSDMWGNVRTIFGGFGDFVGGVFTGDMGRAKEGLQSAWGGTKEFFGGLLDGIGGAFTAVWTDLIKPVTDKLGVTEPIVAGWNALKDGIGSALDFAGEKLTAFKDAVVTPFVEYMSSIDISAAWEGIKTAIGGVLDWMGEKFDWVLEKIKPVLDALGWVGDQGAAAVGAVTGFFGGDGEVSGGSGGRAEDRDQSANPEKKLAIGGALSANKLTLVGERGPELIYPNQGGFVAHNRALERMAAMSKMIGGTIAPAANDNSTPAFGRLASEIGGMGRAVAAAVGAMMLSVSAPEPAIAMPAPVVTINQPAPEQSAPAAQQIIERAAPSVNLAPVFDPIIEQAAPMVQSTVERIVPVLRPVFEQAAPIIEQAATILRPSFAAHEMPAPVVNQAAPILNPLFNVASPDAPVVKPSFATPEPAPMDLSGIMQAPAPRQSQGGGAKVSNVTQQITINAPQNMDVQQLVAELERLKSLAQNDALFDGANDWGQYA